MRSGGEAEGGGMMTYCEAIKIADKLLASSSAKYQSFNLSIADAISDAHHKGVMLGIKRLEESLKGVE